MSLVPYALARRVLFSLDPEVAHEITMAGLAATQAIHGFFAPNIS